MTPTAAAAFLRAQADALLASDEHIELTLQVRTLGSQVAMTPTERSARRRALERLGERAENSTVSTDDAKPPLTLPSEHQELGSLEIEAENREKSGEKPAITHPVSTGAREAAAPEAAIERAENETARDVVLPPGRTRKQRSRRGPLWHFVPEGWAPKDSHRTLALGLLVDVEREAAAFRDHEFNPPRSDPDKAFSGWLRRSADYRRNGGPRGGGGSSALVERSLRIMNEEKANGAAPPPAKVRGIFG